MSAAYAFVLLSLALERLFEPLLVAPAVIGGLVCRRWWQLALAAALIAVAVEMARYVSNFHPALLALSWAAAAAWGSAAYLVKRRFSGKAPSR